MSIEIEDRHFNQICPSCGSDDVVVRGSVFLKLRGEQAEIARGYEYELEDEPLFTCSDCSHDWIVV